MDDETSRRIAYEVAEVLGAQGFDTSFLLNAAGELAQRGVGEYQNRQAAQAAAAQADKVVALDALWADAETMVDLIAATKPVDQNRLRLAQYAAQSAKTSAQGAASSLQSDGVSKRTAAAQSAAAAAAKAALDAPSDPAKQARATAWQRVAASIAGGLAPSVKPLAISSRGQNFLQREYAGVPVWGWAVGGTVATVGVVMLFKALRKRR